MGHPAYREAGLRISNLLTPPTVLLVDDSEDFRRSLSRALSSSFHIDTAVSREEALGKLVPPPDTVLLDLRLNKHDEDGTEALNLLEQVHRDFPQIPVIMITAYGDIETAVECMRLGAVDFIQKDSDIRVLKARIEKAIRAANVSLRLLQLEAELAIVEPRRIIGTSRAISEVKKLVGAVAQDSRTSVLITGETGTGKELIARSIHASGPRSNFPFVGVALAALPPSTIDAELFGYEMGAFTDARRQHQGLIERAHRGVLFLDEIGELELSLQIKLLRFLEERSFSRLSGQKEIPVDVQIVAATNANLANLVAEGRFRNDLYYRLKVYEIKLPPLRERREDIPDLVEYYLKMFGADRGILRASKVALSTFMHFDWPGNIRELRNALESGILKAGLRRHSQVELEDIPEEVRITMESDNEPLRFENDDSKRTVSLDEFLARAELEQVEIALRKAHGKKTEAWKILGLNDRFVFTRRVRRLYSRYPELLKKYPAVESAFLDIFNKPN